jgi:hypothetical protein
MTVKEFNDLELSVDDTVNVKLSDNTVLTLMLHSGNAYEGRGKYVNYSTKELVEAIEPLLLYVGVPSSKIDGIPLNEIETVELISRVSGI